VCASHVLGAILVAGQYFVSDYELFAFLNVSN